MVSQIPAEDKHWRMPRAVAGAERGWRNEGPPGMQAESTTRSKGKGEWEAEMHCVQLLHQKNEEKAHIQLSFTFWVS